MRIRKLCFLTAVALMIPSLAIAQGVASGDLHVIVTDPQGQAVIGAKVVAVDQAKGLEHEASASGLGGYEFLGLPPSTYSVTVTATGFASETATDVVINVGGSANLPMALRIESGKEKITVSAEAALIEPSRTSSTAIVNQNQIENLPINGRNYINFTLT